MIICDIITHSFITNIFFILSLNSSCLVNKMVSIQMSCEIFCMGMQLCIADDYFNLNNILIEKNCRLFNKRWGPGMPKENKAKGKNDDSIWIRNRLSVTPSIGGRLCAGTLQ
uniref:Uncharacterized protein n=1 Tax=Cacopsylla melanoneura TaxID=428564 RepID=A0A8D8S6T4_9HEMI